jgi:hypothetical protein
MPKMVTAFVGTEAMQCCHDSPSDYKGCLKSALGEQASSRSFRRLAEYPAGTLDLLRVIGRPVTRL